MKIFDCFPYFNERELLELRIKLLYDVVDKFIICDANRTHEGKPKDFTAKKTLEQLGLFTDKVTVIEVTIPSKAEVDNNWARENMQRDALISQVRDYDTVCIVTDLDEIMDPNFVKYYAGVAAANKNNILRIPMHYLNAKGDLQVAAKPGIGRPWVAGYLAMKHHFDCYTPSKIRESFTLCLNNVKFTDIYQLDNGINYPAGWHFTWMGGRERMIEKLNAQPEQTFRFATIAADSSKQGILNFIKTYTPGEGSTDPLGRVDHSLTKYSMNDLPELVFKLESVKNYMFPKEYDSESTLKTINITSKYGLKIFCNQFGHPVKEDFVDLDEIDCINAFEKICLDLKAQGQPKYSMIELGSNQAYYSMLFRAIIDGVGINDKCVNILLEPTPDYMERGKSHFERNGFTGIYDNGCIGHYWCWGTRWHDNNLKSYNIDELMEKYELSTLDILHSDIDGNEIRLIETSDRAFRDKKIKYVVLLTHDVWNESNSTYESKIIKTGESRHDVCKNFFLSCGYKLIAERPFGTVGFDGLLIFSAIS